MPFHEIQIRPKRIEIMTIRRIKPKPPVG
jgi:hypothetical protein